MKRFFLTLFILSFCGIALGEQPAIALKEENSKAREQAYQEAKRHDFSFLKSESQLQWFIKNNLLVELVSEVNYEVAPMKLGRPYVRPEVRLFVQQLSRNLFAECGERLVVTSALRFTTRQPKNSVRESVHPTGMAIDIRAPAKKCRKGFEAELLYLEAKGLIQATRERWPLHYHVSVFPQQYVTNVALHARVDEAEYEVRRGDTLSTIASRFGTSITELVALNALESPDFLRVGQEIKLR
jgi:hypothetical protein